MQYNLKCGNNKSTTCTRAPLYKYYIDVGGTMALTYYINLTLIFYDYT